jgi:hypothetical protein
MGIVSNVSTRDTRDHSKSHGDADDPPPTIDQQDVTDESAADATHDRHLTVTPLTGVLIATVLLMGGAVAAIVIGSQLHSKSHSSARTASSQSVPQIPSRGTSGAGGVGGATTLLNLPRQGFSLRYPAAWTPVNESNGSTGGSGSTVASESAVLQISGLNAFSIRTFALQKPVSRPQLADMRAVTDAILSTPGAKLTILDVQSVEVGGLPAVYYLYYFPSGQHQGIHAHYFIFNGARMYSLVFQVVPPSQFPTYAAAFDAVVASFRVSS